MRFLYLFLFLFLVSCHTTKTTQQRKHSKTTHSHKTSQKKIPTATVSVEGKANGVATYYHNKFNGRKTASGEVFNNNKLTAAHRTYPFGTILRVTNPINGKSVVVKVNDRGPFTKGKDLDLSRKAFMQITDNPNKGNLQVNIEVVKE